MGIGICRASGLARCQKCGNRIPRKQRCICYDYNYRGHISNRYVCLDCIYALLNESLG